jgi:putative transposase
MGLSRSTFYDPPVAVATGEVLVRIKAIYDESECYGYRRVGAALRHQGVVVNSKKLRRLMKAHNLQPKGLAFSRQASLDDQGDLP